MTDDTHGADEGAEVHEEGVSVTAGSMAAHQQLRDDVDAAVQAFLSQGGEIKQIEPNVMADPPRKPQSNYGSRPI